MPDYVTLLGAEQVVSAAYAMKAAAAEMSSAASTISEALHRDCMSREDHAARPARWEYAVASNVHDLQRMGEDGWEGFAVLEGVFILCKRRAP